MSIYPSSALSSEDHFVMFFLKAVCLLISLLTCEMVQNSFPFLLGVLLSTQLAARLLCIVN
jgi:hypothetical protein